MESTLYVLDEKELFDYCVHGINLDNCEPSKCKPFEPAIHAVSSNFSQFDITKSCELCGSPGHMFDNYTEVTNSKLTCNHFKMSISAVSDDESLRTIDTMLAALYLKCQDFWKGHSYSKATDSPSAALWGGKEFSTVSTECKNCDNFSTVSVSTECENCDNFSTVSTECKNCKN